MVGQAYHAGVLAALQVDLGWDARDADIVVGTSAGALTGTMLRVGTSPFDLASWVLGRPWTPDQTLLEGLDALRDGLPLIQLRTLLRRWHIPALGTWIPIGGRPWAFRPLAVLASMLPEGQTEMQGLIDLHLAAWTERAWPEGLWVCAVQRRDGARVVFGRQRGEPTDLSLAVAASTAIPGYFAPVTIAGRQLSDGGLHSPTNADLLASEHLDLAIIVSPMSGGGGRLDRRIRHFAQRRVQREIQQLEEAGTRVIMFEPGPTTSRRMGLNPMAVDRAGPVLQSAFFESGALAARPDVRQLLGSIANSRSGR
jgi:NTE family protein